MTRKDYIALARVVVASEATLADLPRGFGSVAAQVFASKLAELCAADNPRFDRARFFEACYQSDPYASRCDECGESIPDTPGGDLVNRHHAGTCSLHGEGE